MENDQNSSSMSKNQTDLSSPSNTQLRLKYQSLYNEIKNI